jgi:hypothetical protein
MKNHTATLSLQRVSYKNRNFYLFWAALVALELAAISLIHQAAPGAGKTLLPLYLFVLIAHLFFGYQLGLFLAVTLPLMSFLVSGMPAMGYLPVTVFKGIALSGFLFLIPRLVKNRYLAFFMALIAFQAAGILFAALWGVKQGMVLNDILRGYPGLLIQAGLGILTLFLSRRHENA